MADLADFFPRPKKSTVVSTGHRHSSYRQSRDVPEELKEWLVRRVACIRGELSLGIEKFFFNRLLSNAVSSWLTLGT